ncbi:hypothetical protein [Salinispora tropica]|uniref:Uncharacterized protein n=1 Tax=Salinispora tropica (strain ATCC BAA-916 / DSM 44818 / JCM 13857 / NBRC 105044 / CNB-440) TaxID=369723 RepID=A4X3C8_SALTO|nr:hypothetical protein [Salinispora tropica]ABP53378.1 hypothetical protein Strop_0901 [Salinispora tropica CNB-440]
MSGTSIDDLLSVEEERHPQRHPHRGSARGRPLRLLLRNLAGVAAVVVVVVVGLRAVGLQASLLVLVAGVLALFVVRQVVRALRPPPASPAVHRALRDPAEFPGSRGEQHDALRAAINSWEKPLGWAATRAERFNGTILPRLGELADERIRLRHGVTRESDPVRARVLLGDRLSTFLENPPRRPPSPRELAAIVAELEKL